MKYLLTPIWRLIVGLYSVIVWLGFVWIYVMYFLWFLKPMDIDKAEFYLELEDDRHGAYIDPKHVTTYQYYKNPWDALLGRVSTRKEKPEQTQER